MVSPLTLQVLPTASEEGCWLWTLSASYHIDAIAWCSDSLAPTMRAAARARQTTAVPKDKVAVLTECRVQDEPFRLVARYGLHDMGQMFLDLPLPNSQHLCQLVR